MTNSIIGVGHLFGQRIAFVAVENGMLIDADGTMFHPCEITGLMMAAMIYKVA